MPTGGFLARRAPPQSIAVPIVRSDPNTPTPGESLVGQPAVAPSESGRRVARMLLLRGFESVPLYFGRLSLGLRGQLAALESVGRPLLPGSVGVELHQALLVGHLFDFSAQIGLYQGSPAQGGELLGMFSLNATSF